MEFLATPVKGKPLDYRIHKSTCRRLSDTAVDAGLLPFGGTLTAASCCKPTLPPYLTDKKEDDMPRKNENQVQPTVQGKDLVGDDEILDEEDDIMGEAPKPRRRGRKPVQKPEDSHALQFENLGFAKAYLPAVAEGMEKFIAENSLDVTIMVNKSNNEIYVAGENYDAVAVALILAAQNAYTDFKAFRRTRDRGTDAGVRWNEDVEFIIKTIGESA